MGYLLIILLLTVLFRKRIFAAQKNSSSAKTGIGFSREYIAQYVLLFLPCLIFFLFVAKSAAFQTDRYISPIYAIFFAAVLCLSASFLLQKFGTSTTVFLMIILAALVTIGSCKNASWEYLYCKEVSALQEKAQYKDTDCICLSSRSRWKIQSKFVEYQNYNSLTVIDKEKVSAKHMKESAELIRSHIQTDNVILTLIDFADPEAYMNKLLAEMPEYTTYTDIGTHFYGTTYYLSSEPQ